MAKVSTVGGWSHTSDAAFRAWVGEVEQILEDAGLVRTADTGQIDPLTVSRPGTNMVAGYSMWRFNDSLQATSPVFIKVQYGTAGVASVPRFVVQTGTGSDGSGNLTGILSAEMINNGQGTIGALQNYVSWATHSEGFAALVFKPFSLTVSSVVSPVSFVVQRTVDNAGAATGDGIVLLVPQAASVVGSPGRFSRVRFLPTAEASLSLNADALGQIPGGITDSRVSLSPQIFLHWTMHPKMLPLLGTAGNVRGEVAVGNEFDMALVGTTPRHYLNVGAAFSNTLASAANVDTNILWED